MLTPPPRKLDANDADELLRLFGYAVALDSVEVDSPMPTFHRLGDGNHPDTPHPWAGTGMLIVLPVVHAAKFAVPCDECYPVPEPGSEKDAL